MKTLVSLLLCAATACVCATALANLPAQKQEALARYTEGQAAYHRGDYELARASFLEAHVLDPSSANMLWDLAKVELKTNHYLDAATHFRAYLALSGATDKEKAQRYLDEAGKRLGHIAIAAVPGTLVVLDGKSLDIWSDAVDVEPGAHVFEAHFGAQSKTVRVELVAGQTVEMDLRFADAPPPAPAVTPSTPQPPSIDHAPPSPTSGWAAGADQLPPPRPSSVPRIVIGSTFAAGAVAGVVLGVVYANNSKQDGDRGASLVSTLPNSSACVNNPSATCQAAHDAAQAEVTDRNLSTAFYVGGGVLAGAAVASWFLLAPKASSTAAAATLVPQLSPTSAGCAVTGRF